MRAVAAGDRDGCWPVNRRPPWTAADVAARPTPGRRVYRFSVGLPGASGMVSMDLAAGWVKSAE